MTIVVGTNTINYAQIRNFIGAPVSDCEFQKKQDFYKVLSVGSRRLFKKVRPKYLNSFHDFNIHKVDLFHFFNAISFGKTPWVTTFETSVPRWGNPNGPELRRGIDLIAGAACRKLIALSGCAAQIQRSFLKEAAPDVQAEIERKLVVLLPPQKQLVESVSERHVSGAVVFTLIGADFFRKGGLEVLRAFDQLAGVGLNNWRLNIVSAMQWGDYASQSTESDLGAAKRIIRRYPNEISHFEQLSNDEVLELLRNTSVGLLPTYGDTFGYSVLEAQAAGCPVISTNIRALPEINSDSVGWVIPVPKNESGNGVLETKGQRQEFANILLAGLHAVIQSILEDPSTCVIKGRNSLQQIAEQHCPARHASALSEIYRAAVRPANGHEP